MQFSKLPKEKMKAALLASQVCTGCLNSCQSSVYPNSWRNFHIMVITIRTTWSRTSDGSLDPKGITINTQHYCHYDYYGTMFDCGSTRCHHVPCSFFVSFFEYLITFECFISQLYHKMLGQPLNTVQAFFSANPRFGNLFFEHGFILFPWEKAAGGYLAQGCC